MFTPPKPQGARWFKFFNAQLVKHPFIANGLTTAGLFGLGDLIAQSVHKPDDAPEEEKATVSYTLKYFDKWRLMRAMAYGGLIFCPIVLRYYPWLNRITHPNVKTQAFRRMAFDQLVFAPVVSLPLYFGCMGAMEGKTVAEINKSFHDKYWSTLVANWAIWPAFQYVNFMMVPLRLRLLSVNCLSVVWNTFLSLANQSKGNPKRSPDVTM